MRRSALPWLSCAAAALLMGAGPAPAPASLEAAGWFHALWPGGLRPARFLALPDGGVALEAQGGGSFVWRRLQGRAECLAWRWRVDQAPPATDLTRPGGDRALSLSVGFDGWPPRSSLMARARHNMALAVAGGQPVPRGVLIFVWGGTGQEPPRFASPYIGELGQVRILRPAGAPRGQWLEEGVDLAAEWRAAFGGEPPPLMKLAIGTDSEDTGSLVRAAVADIRHRPCR